MKKHDYGIYGTEGKHQFFCEGVIYNNVSGLGYVKLRNKLISFISLKELLEALDSPYRYIENDVVNK